MSTTNCVNLLAKLADAVDNVNLKIIDHMTEPSMSYERMCQKRDVTHEYFFEELKREWGTIINDFAFRPDKCPESGVSITGLGKQLLTAPKFTDAKTAVDYLLDDSADRFEPSPDVQTSLHDFVKFFNKNCECERGTIFKFLSRKYFQKYFPTYAADPEVRAYVSGKSVFVLDNLIDLTNQINLDTPEGQEAVSKLKAILEKAKGHFTEMTGGGNGSSINLDYDSVVREIRNQIDRIKNLDYKKTYSSLLEKISERLGLIDEQLHMMYPSVQKADVMDRIKQLGEKLRPTIDAVKQSVKTLVPQDFDSNQIISRVKMTVDELKKNVNNLATSDTAEMSSLLRRKINKGIDLANTHTEKLQSKGNKFYDQTIQAIKQNLQSIKTELNAIELPEVDIQQIKSKIKAHISQLSDRFGPFANKIRGFSEKLQAQNPQAQAKLNGLIAEAEHTLQQIRTENVKKRLHVLTTKFESKLDLVREQLQQLKMSSGTTYDNVISALNYEYDSLSQYARDLKYELQSIESPDVEKVRGQIRSRMSDFTSEHLNPFIIQIKDYVEQVRQSNPEVADRIAEVNKSIKKITNDIRVEKLDDNLARLNAELDVRLQKLQSELDRMKRSGSTYYTKLSDNLGDEIRNLRSRIARMRSDLPEVSMPNVDMDRIKDRISDLSQHQVEPFLAKIRDFGAQLRQSNPQAAKKINEVQQSVTNILDKAQTQRINANLQDLRTDLDSRFRILQSELDKLKQSGSSYYARTATELENEMQNVRSRIQRMTADLPGIDQLQDQIPSKDQITDKLRDVSHSVHMTLFRFRDSLARSNPQLIEQTDQLLNKIRSKLNELDRAGTKEKMDELKSNLRSELANLESKLGEIKVPELDSFVRQTKEEIRMGQNRLSEMLANVDTEKIRSNIPIEEIVVRLGNISEATNSSLNALKSKYPELVAQVDSTFGSIRTELNKLRTINTEDNIRELIDNIRHELSKLESKMKELSVPEFDPIVQNARKQISIIKSRLDELDDDMYNKIKDKVEQLRNIRGSIFTSVERTINDLKASGFNTRDLTAKFNDIMKKFGSGLESVKPSEKEFSNMKIKVNTLIRSLEDTIRTHKDSYPDILNRLQTHLATLEKEMQSTTGKAEAWGRDQTDQLTRSTNSTIQSIKDTINSVKTDPRASTWASQLEEKINELGNQLQTLIKSAKQNWAQTTHQVGAAAPKIDLSAIKSEFDKSVQMARDKIIAYKEANPEAMDKLQTQLNSLADNFKSWMAQYQDSMTQAKDYIKDSVQKQTGGVLSNLPNHNLEDTPAISSLYEGDPKVRTAVSKRINSTLEMIGTQLKSIDVTGAKDYYNKIVADIADKMSHIYSFSVGSELDKLIPNELGSLKQFFVKVISVYYDNLPPIIWAQIFNQMVDNFMTELPHTQEEIFQFLSKYLLLNSGPFILKTLQMIRPILTPELATKYNLTKLKYPLMTPKQIDLIMRKVVKDWDMYNILGSFSASVGHVLMVNCVTNPSDVFIIKMIKPISIAQSCWEYKTLYNVYPAGTCERNFVQSIIKSNGREMNVHSEMKNIDNGVKYYTGTYADVFGSNINARITSVQNKPGIVKPNCWFALAMTLAPGIPLSQLVESDELEIDTKYRAKLHRCLDLLVYHFFYGIMKGGFYHGDLHAGNIFFSYARSQLTLIDFGAVGEMNVFADDTDTSNLLRIFIMSLFYNFDTIFDTMTDILNSKCTTSGEAIDKNSEAYVAFKEELKMYHVGNIALSETQSQKSKAYQKFLFSDERIKAEQGENDPGSVVTETKDDGKPCGSKTFDSVYTYMEAQRPSKETVVENTDEIRGFEEPPAGSDFIGFPGVLEKIIKFYAQSGVNIAIKFTDFYEFQKAYALLLGVLAKTHYSSYRVGMAAKKAIVQFSNVPLTQPGKIYNLYKEYKKESDLYYKLEDRIDKARK